MTLRNLRNFPEKMIPVAMAFVAVGMSILIIGIIWPRFSPSVSHSGTDWNDFFRGLMFGIAIAMEVTGVVLAATAAAAAAKKRKPL
jgi:type II secretory pathway component PulF